MLLLEFAPTTVECIIAHCDHSLESRFHTNAKGATHTHQRSCSSVWDDDDDATHASASHFLPATNDPLHD